MTPILRNAEFNKTRSSKEHVSLTFVYVHIKQRTLSSSLTFLSHKTNSGNNRHLRVITLLRCRRTITSIFIDIVELVLLIIFAYYLSIITFKI